MGKAVLEPRCPDTLICLHSRKGRGHPAVHPRSDGHARARRFAEGDDASEKGVPVASWALSTRTPQAAGCEMQSSRDFARRELPRKN
jgi:hypothetical protein